MAFCQGLKSLLCLIWFHPANRGARLHAVGRLLYWQFYKRVFRRPLMVQVEGCRLFRILPDSKFASMVYYNRLPEWSEMRFLLRCLRKGDGFVDIGANVGFYSVLASVVIEASHLWLIEANPKNVSVIHDQLTLNGLGEAHVFPCALGANEGTVSFVANDRETGTICDGNVQGAFSVPCRSLDALISQWQIPSFTIVKMDVEGCELEVLDGAKHLLQSGAVAAWLFELSDDNLRQRGASATALVTRFKQTGHRFFIWNELKAHLEEVDPLDHVAQNFIACLHPELVQARVMPD